MKKIKVFHTFEEKGRTITLCVKSSFNNPKLMNESEEAHKKLFMEHISDRMVTVGYSVCVKGDTYDKELGKKISEGRADSNRGKILSLAVPNFFVTRDTLIGTAKKLEYLIKNNPNIIKGIR